MLCKEINIYLHGFFWGGQATQDDQIAVSFLLKRIYTLRFWSVEECLSRPRRQPDVEKAFSFGSERLHLEVGKALM